MPSSAICDFASRSAVMSVVSSSAGGDWSISPCESSCVMRIELCCFAKHSCDAPVGSMSTPIVANTLVSSVSDVHAFVGPVLPIGT